MLKFSDSKKTLIGSISDEILSDINLCYTLAFKNGKNSSIGFSCGDNGGKNIRIYFFKGVPLEHLLSCVWKLCPN